LASIVILGIIAGGVFYVYWNQFVPIAAQIVGSENRRRDWRRRYLPMR
jgi:hypothetical protein